MSAGSINSAGELCPEKLYRIDQIQSIMGWSKQAWRERLREGLQPYYLAGRGYLEGATVIAHVKAFGKESKSAPAKTRESVA